jgi:hypothetical protein
LLALIILALAAEMIPLTMTLAVTTSLFGLATYKHKKVHSISHIVTPPDLFFVY